MIACLCRVFSFVITAAIVVSEPEPAVVGTAMNGGRACMTLKSPVICSTVRLGRTMRAAAALAVSIGDPPPTARKPSQPSVRYISRTCSMTEIVGFARTPLKWTADRPAASICARMGGTSTAPVCLPETIITFFTPQPRSSSGIFAVLPAPLTISGLRHGRTREPRSNTVWKARQQSRFIGFMLVIPFYLFRSA